MTKQEVKQRIEKLRKEINHYRYLYHVLDTQEISDPALDSLKHELYELEQEYPEFITLDSPTQRVGGKPLDKFEKVHHQSPMLSIEDIFSQEELIDWQERIQKLVPYEKLDYFAELKIDGFAMSLIYKNGIFVQGSTRGDGLIGENVTQNLKTIEAIPLKLETSNLKTSLPKKIVVRGEIFITRKEFEKINKEQIKKGIKEAISDKNFKEKVKKCQNPYGDGKTGPRIAGVLSKIRINKKLLQKKITY